MKSGMEKTRLLCAVLVMLFLGCLLPGENVFGREREQYTSVTVEFRDADTKEVFYTYEHPWQRTGRAYTYHPEEKIHPESGGCYWYDEAHEGAVSKIEALSDNPKDNRIILYYRLYDMGEKEYAVKTISKNAATNETIRTETINLGESVSGYGARGYYSADMDYRITDAGGKSYLYDARNEENVPIVEINENPERNRVILYYREGDLQEGEAVVEVYYRKLDTWGLDGGFLAKSYIFGLSVGDSYLCEDENILQAHRKYCYDEIFSYWEYEEESSLAIETLSQNPKENVIEIRHVEEMILSGVPPIYRFATVTIRYLDEDTGKVIMEQKQGADQTEIFQYHPRQIFYDENGALYYLDNTKPENVLQADPKNNDIDKEKWESICKEQIVAYYRPVRQPGDSANIRANYLDTATGEVIKAETVFGAAVGSAYTYVPKGSFALNGRLYTFDEKNAGNVLALQKVSGHPDIDELDLHYTGKSLKKILKTPKIKKLSRKGSKSAKLQIGKIKGVSGYQVVYAYNKKFKSAKKVFSTKTKVTLKKLKKNKTCYVKVRAYVQTDDGKVYGAFCKRRKL